MLVMDENLQPQCKESVRTEPMGTNTDLGEKTDRYSGAGTLRTHTQGHNLDKSNKCNQCDYASAIADSLRTHLKKHSGEKPNKCNQCDYASIHKQHLSRHLKIHGGKNQQQMQQM